MCAKLKPAVSGLETAFPGKVIAHNINASTPEAKAACKDLGFKSHGLVVRSAAGKVLLKRADHGVEIEEVEQRLREILGS